MGNVISQLKQHWLDMIEPPWHHSGPSYDETGHLIAWIVGWVWSISGLLIGAFIAPYFVQFFGLTDTPFQDYIGIGVSVSTAFLIQLLGFVSAAFWMTALAYSILGKLPVLLRGLWLFCCAMALIAIGFLPIAGVGVAIFRYVTWVGTGQGHVTVAFVGGLLVKLIAIPLIKGLVTGKLFHYLMKWLRAGKDKTAQ